MNQAPKSHFVFGEFRLDGAERLLRRGETAVPLAPKILDTLLLLVENSGHLVEKDEFMKRLWPDTFVGEDALARNISILRKTLGETSSSQEFIATVPTRGYRFVAPVQKLEDSEAQPLESSDGIAIGISKEEPSTEFGHNNNSEHRPPTTAVAPGVSIPPGLSALRGTARPLWLRQVAFITWVLGAGSIAGMGMFYLLSPAPTPHLLRVVPLTDSASVHGNQNLLTDGPRLYFFERTRGRWVPKWMPSSGGATVPIELPFFADFQDISPDGSELLVRQLHEPWDAWAVSTAGGTFHRMGVPIEAAAYTRDGHQVLYSLGSDVFMCEHDGSNKRRIVSLPGEVFGISISPQGDRLRFFVGQGPDEGVVLWESRSDGTNLHRLIAESPSPRDEWGGGWSPDGRWFVYSAPRGANALRDVWLLPAPTLFRRNAAPIPLTSGPMDFSRPIFSRDGKRIFVVGDTRHGELTRYDFSTRQFTQFLGGISAENVAFSPDKQSLIYVSYPDEGLWRARADGSRSMPLTVAPMKVGRASWSPDGARIAFEASPRRGASWQVYVIASTGGAAEPVAQVAGHGGLTWRSDGKSLIVGKVGRNSALQIVDLERHSVTALPSSEGGHEPSLSPSGRYLALKEDDSLIVWDMATNRKKVLAKVFREISYPEWSADERYVYFNCFMDTASALYRASISDGSVTRLMDLTQFSATGSWGTWSTITPDGSLLLLRNLGGTDVYAIEYSEH